MKTIEAFKQEEYSKINENFQMKGTLSTLMGLPTMVTGVTQAVALGSALGAGSAGIGILTGPVIGAVLAGTLAFILIGGFSIVVFPKLANGILMGLRRILEGSFDYRYLKSITQSKANTHYEKMVAIAHQLKILEERNLLTSEMESQMLNHLSPLQQKLFKQIKWVVDDSVNEEQARERLARNIEVYHLKKQLCDEYLLTARQNRMWDNIHKHNPSQQTKAKFDAQGMGPGRSPFSLIRFVLKTFFIPLKSIIQPIEPDDIGQREQTIIMANPEIAYHKKDNLVCGLLECDIREINGFAQSVQDRLLDYNSLCLPRLEELTLAATDKIEKLSSMKVTRSAQAKIKMQAACAREVNLAQTEKEFLTSLKGDIETWFNKPRTHLKKPILDMSGDELSDYLNCLEEKQVFRANKDYYQARINRVKAYMKSKETLTEDVPSLLTIPQS